MPIRAPSLRERADDIPLLISFFADRIYEKHNLKPKVIENEVVWELQHYAWPEMCASCKTSSSGC